jgi:hypothetical protein
MLPVEFRFVIQEYKRRTTVVDNDWRTTSLTTADPNWEQNPVNNQHEDGINASQSLKWDTLLCLYYICVSFNLLKPSGYFPCHQV